jgi:hypothetical protein
MQEQVCGPQLKIGAAAFAASTPAGTAGPTVPQSSILGSTDDCHISPLIAEPKAARYRRADRLPDDVTTHYETVLASVCQMTGVDVLRT